MKHKSVIDWLQYMRDVCSAEMVANPLQIGGGPGTIVAVDESVVARRKPGNIHARPIREMWMVGGVQLGTSNFFMEIVPNRNEQTLLQVIEASFL